MITTETSLLCPRCFTPLSPRGICPICGKRPPRVSTPAGHLAQGTRLKERYVVSSAIGEGGFGITYLGYDAMKRRKVAIKEYFPSSVVMRDGCSAVVRSENMRSRFSAGKKRFTDEAKNMAAIKDLDGVPSVLDYFSENGTAYIVMEYLGGETLKNRISGKGKMREEEALRVLRPVFVSLALIHDAGLIHRDVSADNIILTDDGSAKLIDFGASVSTSAKRQNIELKRRYAPPEQYEKNAVTDRRVDVYAAGATLYYCLTGALPPESTERLRQDKLSFPAKMSPNMKTVLTKALALDRNDRYPDMRDLLRDIEKSR